jgi:hypothetical protein
VTAPLSYTRGAFAVFEPDDTRTLSRFLPFRFNPEGLQRQLTVEQAQGAAGGTGAAPGSEPAGGEQGADAASGTLKHSLSVALRFDLAEREEAGPGMPVGFGVLPEVSALEDLLYAPFTEADAPSDRSVPVRARGRRPLVLLIWGERRVLPVRITGMTINETLYNGMLYPVRAEVEVALEVLGDREAKDNKRVAASLDFTAAHRRQMARVYLDSTARQGTNVSLPL